MKTPAGLRLAVCALNAFVCMDAEPPRQLNPEDFAQSVYFGGTVSPDGRWAVVLRCSTGPATREPVAEIVETGTNRRRPLAFSGEPILTNRCDASWSPGGRRFAIATGGSSNLTVHVFDAQSGKELAIFGGFSGHLFNARWISDTRLWIQGRRLVDIPTEFSVSGSALERLEGWRNHTRGVPSNVTLDTRVPPSDLLSQDVWLLDVDRRAIDKLASCPQIFSSSSSPGHTKLAVLYNEDWSSDGDPLLRAGDRPDRRHTALFFSIGEKSRLAGKVGNVALVTGLNPDTVWRDDQNALLVTRGQAGYEWTEVAFHDQSLQTSASPIEGEARPPKLWLYAGHSLLYKSSTDQWWVKDATGRHDLRQLLPEITDPPIEVLPSEPIGATPTVAAMARNHLYRLGFEGTARVIGEFKLEQPFLWSAAIFAVLDRHPAISDPFWQGRYIVYADLNHDHHRIDTVTGRQLALGKTFTPSSVAPRAGAVVKVRYEKGVQILSLFDGNGARTDLARSQTFYSEIPPPEKKRFQFTPSGLKQTIPPGCCTATVYLPPGGGNRPLPAIVDIYLGRNPGASERLIDGNVEAPASPLENARLYTTHGYALVALDMPWKYGPKAGDMIDAIEAYVLPAIQRGVEQRIIDPDRIAFLGHSFGGSNVFDLLRRTHIAKAAMEYAGTFDLVGEWGRFGGSATTVAESFNTSGRDVEVERGQYSIGGPPWEMPERYIYNSPNFHARDIRTPTLIMEGDIDFVSVENAKYAYQALRRVGTPARLIVFYGEYHSVSTPGNMEVQAREILDWLKTYLGPAVNQSSQEPR